MLATQMLCSYFSLRRIFIFSPPGNRIQLQAEVRQLLRYVFIHMKKTEATVVRANVFNPLCLKEKKQQEYLLAASV